MFCRENTQGLPIWSIRKDHATEFKGEFINFYDQLAISLNFFTPRQP